VVALCVLEHTRIGMAHSWRPLAGDAALVEQAEQAAAGECALPASGTVMVRRTVVRARSERALCGGGRIVALCHVVLQESAGAVGPSLARAQGAVVRGFHRTGVACQIDRTRLEQLVQLRDLGRVLLRGGTGPVGDQAALEKPLPGLQRLLLLTATGGDCSAL
jgi:ribosomal protein S28E/S33